jgi:DNA-binding transcriptional MerR regulator
MQIGQVAAQAGVSVQTVRLYERLGLLTHVERRPSGYREYPATVCSAFRRPSQIGG